MAIKSITQRWIFNSLSIILAVVILGVVGFSYVMRSFYYNGVKQAIEQRVNVVYGVLLRFIDDNNVNFNTELRDIVENSEDKDKFEITAIDHNGRIALSSSGFSYSPQQSGDMPDYEEAVRSSNGRGYYIGRNSSGEKIMALTVMMPSITAEYSAIRYAVSMEAIDRKLQLDLILFLGVALVIIAFVLISGLYFVKSIVLPVRDVGAVARKFATGDMSARIVKKSNDELGELCDIINFMADEISASEEMKNEFISSVSHELRTPLTAIKGWSETLMSMGEGESSPEMIQKGMRVITNETERLSIMVEELLDFSRMQNGRLTLVKTNIDILAELGEAVLVYAERARRDQIELVYDEPEMVSPIFGDKNRLRQVFLNIIDNALKYSDGGDTVRISVHENAGYVYIVVSDTGCGISEEDLPKIKTKFYKANLTRRGSGIGLAVADEIVQLHEGEILIASQLDIGTTVTVSLPVTNRKNETITEISTTMEFSLTEDKERIRNETDGTTSRHLPGN